VLYLLITGIPRSGTTPRHYAGVFTAKDRHECVQKCSDDLRQRELASLKAFMAEHFDYAYRFYPDLDNC
jgi:hypothetical protein